MKVVVVPLTEKSDARRAEPDTETRPPSATVAFSVVFVELKRRPEIPPTAELKLETVELESPEESAPFEGGLVSPGREPPWPKTIAQLTAEATSVMRIIITAMPVAEPRLCLT